MGKIKKILENELVGGTQNTDVYPVTSTKAVYDENNERLDNILNRRGVVNISTNYNSEHIAEVLTLAQALSKVPNTDRVLGFQGKYLASDGWHTIIYIGDSLTSWSDTTKWIDLSDRIFNSISKNATFAGIATPTTNPGTPDGPVFYIAAGPGIYPNFSGITINTDETAILVWNNGATWEKEISGFASSSYLMDEIARAKSAELDLEQKIITGTEQLFENGYISHVNKGEVIDFTVVNNNTYVHLISEVEGGDVAIITATGSGGKIKPYIIVNSEGVVIDYEHRPSISNERIVIPNGGTKLIVGSKKSVIHSCYIIKKGSTKDVIDSAYSVSNGMRELILKGTISPMRAYNSCLTSNNGAFLFNNAYPEYTTYLYDLSNYIGKTIYIDGGDKVVSTPACVNPYIIVKDYLNVALSSYDLHDPYTFESNGLFRTRSTKLSYNVTEKCYLYVQAYPDSLPNIIVREYSPEQVENVYKITKIVEQGATEGAIINYTLERGTYILSTNFKEVSKGWRYYIDGTEITEVVDDSIRVSFSKETRIFMQVPYMFMLRDANNVVIGGNVVFSIDKLINEGELASLIELDNTNSEVADLKNSIDTFGEISNNSGIIQGWLPNRMTGTLDTFEQLCYTADLGYKLSDLKKQEINKVQRVFLFDFLDDDCVNANTGVIDEDRVYNNIKSCLSTLGTDGLFYYIKLGGYWSTEYSNLAFKVSGSSTDTEEGAYCFFPRNVYKYLYSIGATYEIDNYSYPEKDKVVMINPDSDYVRNVLYDTILRLFATFFNEEAAAPDLSSENNETQYVVKRGDFINIIGIHFFGLFGEGGFSSNAYPNVSNDGMIGMVEIYKKHLYNYWLCAPIDGKNPTGDKYGLDEFQHYIMTSTYGNTVTDSNGRYYGEKGIGLFNGHVNWDMHDCSLYKEELSQKYKNSVLSGENAQSRSSEPDLLANIQRVMSEHYSAFRVRWDGLNQTTQYVLGESKKLLGRIGYKLLIVTNIWPDKYKSQSNAQSGILNGEIVFVNIGSSPCYYEYWKAQVVVREAYTDSVLEIIDIPLEQSLMQLTQKCVTGDSFSSKDTFSIKLPKIDATKYNGANYNVFLRFIDTHKVSENMFLANKNRTNKGEYCIFSNNYIVHYSDSTTYINNPCNGWRRSLMFDFEPKEPYKEGYEFVGWYADKELTKKVKSISVNCRQNITLYPKFNLADWSEIL